MGVGVAVAISPPIAQYSRKSKLGPPSLSTLPIAPTTVLCLESRSMMYIELNRSIEKLMKLPVGPLQPHSL